MAVHVLDGCSDGPLGGWQRRRDRALSESRNRLNKVGAWMGIAFVVLFVAGFIVFPTPSDNKNTVEWERWWTDSGHRVGAIIGAYLMVLGLLAFVWFMWSLNQRLRDRGGMMITFGSLFVALAMISALVRASIPGSKQFGDNPVPPGDFARQFDQIGFGVLLVAALLVLPVGIARNLVRSFRGTMLAASGVGAAAALIGLFVSNAAKVFDEEGTLQDPAVRAQVEKYIAGFARFVARHSGAATPAP